MDNPQHMTDLERVTTFRRDLHKIPELSYDLPHTCAYVRSVLETLSCKICEPCPSCICAFFDVDAVRGCAGIHPTTALRADMDALPITEHTNTDFCSTIDGHMHACGHDGHMAMALATACWVNDCLARLTDSTSHDAVSSREKTQDDGCALQRNILFVFQPAEETTGGARVVCESGVFEHYHVDQIFGFHVWPDLPAGVIASRPGPLLARASETTITIQGTSSHIAKSSEGHDALLAAAHTLSALEQLMDELSTREPCLLKFGHMTSGVVRNAISAQSVLEGSLRVFSDSMFDTACEGITSCVRTACEPYGCSFDVHFSDGYPPVINDEALFDRASEALVVINNGASARVNTIGGISLADAQAHGDMHLRGNGLAEIPEPLLIAEDFAFYQQHMPGVFLLLGTGTGIALHSDEFCMDERILLRGLAAYQQLITIEP